MAKRVKVSFLRRSQSHHLGSTRTLVMLLRPWISKTLYDDCRYLCLVASNKQQIQWTRIRRNSQEHWISRSSLEGADSSNHKVVIAMNSVQIIQYLASDAVW